MIPVVVSGNRLTLRVNGREQHRKPRARARLAGMAHKKTPRPLAAPFATVMRTRKSCHTAFEHLPRTVRPIPTVESGRRRIAAPKTCACNSPMPRDDTLEPLQRITAAVLAAPPLLLEQAIGMVAGDRTGTSHASL